MSTLVEKDTAKNPEKKTPERSADDVRDTGTDEALTDADADADDSSADGQDKSQADDSPKATEQSDRRSISVRSLIAAVAVLALLAGGGFIGWKSYQGWATDRASAAALEASKEFAVTLTSVNSENIDESFGDVLAGATGEFKDMYSRSSGQLKQLLVDNNAASQGVVIDAAVKSATTDEVVVLLFVDQAITNTATPEQRVDRSRVVMTMSKTDGQWLASKVDLP